MDKNAERGFDWVGLPVIATGAPLLSSPRDRTPDTDP
jgi:hypothetical protein